MELSSEDSFRLNVLLANKPLAIRIDESRLVVHGLSDRGEAKVQLNPTGRPEPYLRAVRELISGHILGSPGGYPVYLRRWTRMGQMRDQSLEQLLMLGEPEAVVAAVGSPGLTEELARRAWWAMEDAENARRMLAHGHIATSAMGPVLAEYLLEYLPFETESDRMMASVRLMMQPGLLPEAQRRALWQKSGRKQAYLLGFLQALPDALPEVLPEPAEPRADAADLERRLAAERDTGNPVAALLLRVAGAPGQAYLKTMAAVLSKPPNQDVLSAAFDCLRDYFAAIRQDGDPGLAMADLQTEAGRYVDAAADPGPMSDPTSNQIRACLAAAPELREQLIAMRLLSGASYGLLRPLLPDPTTLGSLMRRKIAPVTDLLQSQIDRLRTAAS
ncbi:sulfur reduction protein DsrS [Thiohalocapsa marina]|uniref:Sulfur reduction protein DsrS n=1 Tax=Thiohalocapsa marina TaxID=424902 RepID=A0A5M8FUH1_9GAMM|nr:sulfur reduction protein DsrS [Thiohalocapsa marina]KAA6187450.1 sulfur reduction protein DsrS [Thiohalocapsa marina]